MGKAQAPLIQYLLTILLGIIVVVSVIAILFTLHAGFLRNEIRQGLRQIATQTSDSIVKLFETAKNSKTMPSNYSSVLISEVDLNLPARVSNRNYEIFLVASSPIWQTVENLTVDGQSISTIEINPGVKIIARTTQEPIESIEHDILNIGIGVQGRSENGGKLRYYRYNINGTIHDKIILGEADILIDIESVV
ncbi:MAG: hypothetical protein QMD12_00680 [Candidatus Aenigmarchaeota archaeon]|nr:hypothetical protein [Candidatus Aenigmarchaeota archaeon]